MAILKKVKFNFNLRDDNNLIKYLKNFKMQIIIQVIFGNEFLLKYKVLANDSTA